MAGVVGILYGECLEVLVEVVEVLGVEFLWFGFELYESVRKSLVSISVYQYSFVEVVG